MSDPNDPNSPDYVEPDPNDPNYVDPNDDPANQRPQTGAVYPVNDGRGGTAFVIGNTDEQASFEDWAAQNSVMPRKDDDVEYDEDGNPVNDEPEEIEFGTTKGTEADKVSAVSAAADDLNE